MLVDVDDGRPEDRELAALRAAGTDREQALGGLFEHHRRRLLRMVQLRMDPRLKTRVGASDVLQDAYLEIARRVGDYLDDPRLPFFLWLRRLTAERLIMLHRRHLGAQRRDVRRQVPMDRRAFPAASSAVLANRLVTGDRTPSEAAARAEIRAQIEDALEGMSPTDREVLVMRHFEELSNVEVARELGIEESAASKRYLRALKRLREILRDAGLEGSSA